MLHNGMIYRRAGRHEFLAALKSAKAARGDEGLCVSEPEVGAELYLSADGLSGYALHGDYFGAVFSQSKGRLAGMVRDARARAKRNGETTLRLDCFEPLAEVYQRHGFFRTGSIAFDWAYAPAGWSSRHGEPDVVLMAMPLSEVPMNAPVVTPARFAHV